jgi:hypothetical protein
VNYQVTGRIHVTAQDPRAIAVRGGLLFVAAFESGKKRDVVRAALAGDGQIGSQCSAASTCSASSPTRTCRRKNIVIDPDAPDRDLFVYSTATDQEVAVVTGLGTLGYGLAVDATARCSSPRPTRATRRMATTACRCPTSTTACSSTRSRPRPARRAVAAR